VARIFTGDYSTGDFRQWQFINNVDVLDASAGNHGPLGTGPGFPPRKFYSAQVISEDKDAGYVARYELRQNDIPWWGGQARSEVAAPTGTFAGVGSTMWYAMSFKFDRTFPTNHFDLGWGVIHQYHDDSAVGYSPPIAFGWPYELSVSLTQPGCGFRSGYWYLQQVIWPPATTPGVVPMATHVIPVFEFPFNLGQWHDIKLQIKWEQNQNGFIRLWWNGQRQILYGGGKTLYGPTLPPGTGSEPKQLVTGQSVQQGYYRDNAVATPGIVYHAGFRMADDVLGL